MPPAAHKTPNEAVPASDEAILKVTKEIVVKFIEANRLSPENFEENFRNVYRVVHDAVRGNGHDSDDQS